MYSLLKAVLIVSRIDNSSLRLQSFEDIAKKNSLIRFAYFSYRSLALTPIGPAMLLLYGLKCYLNVKLKEHKKTDLICFASYPNEHTSINYIKSNLLEITTQDLSISLRNLLYPGNWLAVFWYIMLTPRLYRFARRCSGVFHFMPACRIFSTVTYYLRFKRILSSTRSKGVLIANHYSPECTAIAAAAHSFSLKVIFTNHSHVPLKIAKPPPLLMDLAILTSENVLDRYKEESKQNIHYVLIGYEQEEKPLNLDFSKKPGLTIGVFLTALTNKSHVREVIDKMQKVTQISRFLLRPHPVALLNEDFTQILNDYSVLEISNNSRLCEDINKCDLVICGNSSVVIEIIKGGCPVLYDSKLDQLPFDYNGFVEGELIPQAEHIDKEIFRKLSEFYQRGGWVKIMHHFDASYQVDCNKLIRDVEKEIKNVLTGCVGP